MEYFVIATDGKEYGPATVQMLAQWAAEKRLEPTTQLKDASTGEVRSAIDVPGIFPQQPAQQPYAAPPQETPTQTAERPQPGPVYSGGYTPPAPIQYPRQPEAPSASSNDIAMMWVMTVLSFACCGLFAIPGVIFANKVANMGNSAGTIARILCIVALVLNVVLIGGWFLLVGAAVASGGR